MRRRRKSDKNLASHISSMRAASVTLHASAEEINSRAPWATIEAIDGERCEYRRPAKERRGRGGATTGGAGAAARTLRMLGAILEHAKRAKLVKVNAVHGVRQLAE